MSGWYWIQNSFQNNNMKIVATLGPCTNAEEHVQNLAIIQDVMHKYSHVSIYFAWQQDSNSVNVVFTTLSLTRVLDFCSGSLLW